MSFGVGPVLGAIVPQACDDPPQSEWPGWTGVLFANEFHRAGKQRGANRGAAEEAEEAEEESRPMKRGMQVHACVARPAGIEPATPAFGGQYSIH